MTLESDGPALRERLAECKTFPEYLALVDAEVKGMLPETSVIDAHRRFVQLAESEQLSFLPIDCLCVTFVWVFQTQLWAYIPKEKPLDRADLTDLARFAAFMVSLAIPRTEEVAPVEFEREKFAPDLVDSERVFRIFATWFRNVGEPCLRGEQSSRASGIDDDRALQIRTAWQVTNAFSPIHLSESHLLKSVLDTVFPEVTREERGDLSDDIAVPFLELLNKDAGDLRHFQRDARNAFSISARGVRDRWGTEFASVRDRRTKPTLEANLPPAIEREDEDEDRGRLDEIRGVIDGVGEALKVRESVDDGVARIASLRELASRTGDAPELVVVRRIATELLQSGARSRVDAVDHGLNVFLRAMPAIESPALKAAVAHHLFGKRIGRVQLAQIFSVSPGQIERLAGDAATLVSSRSADVAS